MAGDCERSRWRETGEGMGADGVRLWEEQMAGDWGGADGGGCGRSRWRETGVGDGQMAGD